MYYFKLCIFFSFCLCIMLNCRADKIEKKGTILNSNCNPIGTRCKTSLSPEISHTYIFNEPRAGSFSMQISEPEVNKIPALRTLLQNKTNIFLEEAITIQDDVTRALHMPSPYIVSPGNYKISYQQNSYTIIFKE